MLNLKGHNQRNAPPESTYEIKGCSCHLSSAASTTCPLTSAKNSGAWSPTAIQRGPTACPKLWMLSAIAFLPPNDVIQGSEKLADHLRSVYKGDADDLLEHFDKTCIGSY